MTVYNKPTAFLVTRLKDLVLAEEANVLHSSFRLFFIKRGACTFYLDTKQCSLHEGHILYLLPGTRCRIEANDELDGYCIDLASSLPQNHHYGPELVHENFMQFLSKGGSFLLDHNSTVETCQLMDKMMEIRASDQLFQRELFYSYLKIFFVNLLRRFGNQDEQQSSFKQSVIVRRFLTLLEQNFKTKKLVTDYASSMFLTPSYLNTIVKQSTGYPASYHIKQRIVLEAKRMGVYTDLCMKQVAFSLGFHDIPHFSKYFKSATGVTFTDFKQEKYLLPIAV